MDTEATDILNTLNWILGIKAPKVIRALQVIEEAIETYQGDVWFSFNSGKDNTACFFMTAAVLYRRSGYKSKDFRLKSLTFEEEDPFVECESYMDDLKRIFRMEVLALKNSENLTKSKFMKAGMVKLVQEHKLRAVIMGSRKTDPYCGNLTHFSKSSTEDGWSAFIRVLPIIDWDFKEIWKFFNECKVPYCSLYDKGFTYLGDRQDSVPNPYLRTKTGWYLPASACNTNYEPFSRKSILKNLNTNEAGKILITEANIKHLLLRVEYDVSPEEIRNLFVKNIKSFSIFQMLLNETSENLKFDIDFGKATKWASTGVLTEPIENEEAQDAKLSEVLGNHISQMSQQLRVPLYILYLDLVRKNCVIFG
jgi:3'-phosphoadenosine 5'-phosphosulfate sulfotransferase (PAPS reductase)/FAD synthetase